MNLFGKKTPADSNVVNTKIKTIKILGPGCGNCQALEKATKKALAQLGWQVSLEHVTDFEQITNYGVMSTPGLVFNQKVISAGRVLTVTQIKQRLLDFQGEADV